MAIDKIRLSVPVAGHGTDERDLMAASRLDIAAIVGDESNDPAFLQYIGSRELWNHAKARYCWDYFPDERAKEFGSPFWS
jgi:hypothetical protein